MPVDKQLFVSFKDEEDKTRRHFIFDLLPMVLTRGQPLRRSPSPSSITIFEVPAGAEVFVVWRDRGRRSIPVRRGRVRVVVPSSSLGPVGAEEALLHSVDGFGGWIERSALALPPPGAAAGAAAAAAAASGARGAPPATAAAAAAALGLRQLPFETPAQNKQRRKDLWVGSPSTHLELSYSSSSNRHLINKQAWATTYRPGASTGAVPAPPQEQPLLDLVLEGAADGGTGGGGGGGGGRRAVAAAAAPSASSFDARAYDGDWSQASGGGSRTSNSPAGAGSERYAATTRRGGDRSGTGIDSSVLGLTSSVNELVMRGGASPGGGGGGRGMHFKNGRRRSMLNAQQQSGAASPEGGIAHAHGETKRHTFTNREDLVVHLQAQERSLEIERRVGSGLREHREAIALASKDRHEASEAIAATLEAEQKRKGGGTSRKPWRKRAFKENARLYADTRPQTGAGLYKTILNYHTWGGSDIGRLYPTWWDDKYDFPKDFF